MTDATAEPAGASDLPTAGRTAALIRLLTGVVQGLALFLLYRAATDHTWPSQTPMAMWPLVMIFLLTPPVLLAAAGRMRPRTLAVWAGAVAVFATLVGLYAGWTYVGVPAQDSPLAGPAFALGVIWVFVAHHLVAGADASGRWIADYRRYYDTGWRDAVRLGLCGGFILAMWILLRLGAAMFDMIGVEGFGRLLQKPWFAIPVTTLAFAGAAHLTDVSVTLIRGVRTVVLALLSWLLPLMALMAAAFLRALPFTGLGPLWATRSAAAILLAATAAIIVLLNAAYQDGTEATRPPRVLQWAARLAAILPIPLVGIAAYGVMLRIGQHGLTPERVIAVACLIAGAVYAVGYGWAAIRRDGWLRLIERTNVVAAFVVLGLITLLLSPLADPVRVSVSDQMSRLRDGEVAPADFDYAFLRWDGDRFGRDALAELARSNDVRISSRARDAQEADSRHVTTTEQGAVAQRRAREVRLEFSPAGTSPPADFIEQYPRLSTLLESCTNSAACQGRLFDLDQDGDTDVLIATAGAVMGFAREADGRWFESVRYYGNCPEPPAGALAAGLKEGHFET
ncbi:MAG TPA: DUF4153 domain-containing protein, partial [Caulobacteraceae bacterium]